MIELNFNQITTLQQYQTDGNYPEAYRYMRDIVRDLQNGASTLEQANELDRLQNWLESKGSASHSFLQRIQLNHATSPTH